MPFAFIMLNMTIPSHAEGLDGTLGVGVGLEQYQNTFSVFYMLNAIYAHFNPKIKQYIY